MSFLEVVECIVLLIAAGTIGYSIGYCEKKFNEMRFSDEQRIF